MIVIYSAIVNVIIDFKIFKIAMFANLIDKILKIVKKVWLSIIHKCIDVVYIITDMFRALTILAVIAVAISFIEPFTSI